MRVLAIDPGYDRIGVAILEKELGGKEQVIFSECFTTERKEYMVDRLTSLGLHTEELINIYAPDAFAIETLFFQKNTKTAMRVAEARGILIYTAKRSTIPVYEYNPGEIKVAVTGDGKADKTSVITMVHRLVQLSETDKKRHDDELDAIAVGLTHLAIVK